MWQLKNTTVPVIVGALGTIKKQTNKHINKIPGSLSQYYIDKIACYETVQIFTINVTEKYHIKPTAKISIRQMYMNTTLPHPRFYTVNDF